MRIGYHASPKFSAILLSPFERLEDSLPSWGRVFAAAVAMYQYLIADALTPALFLVLMSGAVDYWVGVRVARSLGKYDPQIAHRGFHGKVAGVLLVLLVRVFENYVRQLSMVDTKGAVAAAICISLFAVDLQSIAHHREMLGAKPIPILSAVLNWIQQIASSRIPVGSGSPPEPATPQRRSTDPT